MTNKKYDIPEDEIMMVTEPAPDYGITIPVTVPTIGGYTIEALRHELTEFAKKLIFAQSPATKTIQHTSWRAMPISDGVKKMSLGKSSLTTDNRTVKQMLEESLNEKYV